MNEGRTSFFSLILLSVLFLIMCVNTDLSIKKDDDGNYHFKSRTHINFDNPLNLEEK